MKTYLGNMTDKCKIHLTMTVNFISSKDNDNEWLMHSKGDNREINIGNETWNYSHLVFKVKESQLIRQIHILF